MADTQMLRNKVKGGLAEIEEAILVLLRDRPNGMTNGQITEMLGLESDQAGKQKNYLAWSILGRMMKQGTVSRVPLGKSQVYKAIQ